MTAASQNGFAPEHHWRTDMADTPTDVGRSPKVWNKRAGDAPAGAVYVGRGTPWGNPFIMRAEFERDAVCDHFEREVLPKLDVSALIGRDLVCWCAPKRCHADALLRAASSIAQKEGF